MIKKEVKRMKQEFIIGDIVMYKNRIHTIIDILASNGYELSYVRHPVSPVRLSGVPLTPEILEKNGWYGATHSKQSDDNTKILYKTFKRKGYPTIKVSQDLKITCELSPFIVKLESVSDLQHLLFGLGLNSEMEL